MILDKLLVDKISYLSKVKLSERERENILVSLNEILIWFQKLDELNTDDLHPLEISAFMQESNLREDLPTKTLTHEAGLKNAPDKDTNYFHTPPINNM